MGSQARQASTFSAGGGIARKLIRFGILAPISLSPMDRFHRQLLLLQLHHRPAHQGRVTIFASRTSATKSLDSVLWIFRLVRSPVEASLFRSDINIYIYIFFYTKWAATFGRVY